MTSTKTKIIAVALVLAFIATVMTPVFVSENGITSGGANASTQSKAINDYLYSLRGTYNPDTTMIYTGETITQIPACEFTPGSQETITIKYTKQSVDNFSTSAAENVSSKSTIVYPGALLIANNDMANGNPDSLSFKDRGDVVYSLTLGGSGSSFTANPQYYGDVRNAIDDEVEKWARTNGSLSANIVTQSVNDSSSKQTAIALGVDLNVLDGIGINAESDKDNSTTSVVIKYTQVFYTVSASVPSDPAGYFGPLTTLSDVQNKITSKEPAIYVNTVTYGRMVVAQYTTTSKIDNFKAAVDLTIKGNTASLSADQKEALENSTFQACIVGGNGTRTKLASIDDVNKIINSTPTKADVKGAALLSANMVYVDSSKNACTYQSTDYLEKSVFITRKVNVKVDQDAWFDLHVVVYANVYESIDDKGNYVGLENNKCVIDSGRLNLNEDKLYEITAQHIGDIKMSLEIYSSSGYFSNNTLTPTPTEEIYIHTSGDLFKKHAEVYVDGIKYYTC